MLNTRIRTQRWLNRRYLADDIGREVAALVLCEKTRPYKRGAGEEGGLLEEGESTWEQQRILEWEEGDWVKSAKADDKEEDGEAGAKRERHGKRI